MKRLAIVLTILSMFLILASPLVAVPAVSAATEWRVPGDFATIQAAIDSGSVSNGDTIRVGAGNHAGALVTKAVIIKGEDGATINSGPVHWSGMIQGFRIIAGGGGATISHLRFEVDLAIMNGAAVNNVTVEHCTFTNTVQGISNWRGSGWTISHNTITDLRTRCGGGIAILIGDFDATAAGVNSNVVSHNKISGTLHVAPGDCGGYNGTGIVLYADFRWGAPGAIEIANNHIIKNNIALVSDTPLVVDVAAVELTDTRDNSQYCVIHDNAIGFNDFRGTALQIALTPTSLANCNQISRNLGNNRGHGLHPSTFKP